MTITSKDLEAYAAPADRDDFEAAVFEKLTSGCELSSLDCIVARLRGWDVADLIEEMEVRKSM